MNGVVETNWVKAPHQRGGLDHLGVQAPCIQIYGSLLPGITNVTDRARYYSFYPWLFSKFEEQGWRDSDQIVEMLRRAECLLTLISIRHANVVGGASDVHRAAMVGSDTLGAAVREVSAGQAIRLSDYSHQVDGKSNRYFMNKHGGLGQYYYGVLRELGLFTGDSVSSTRVVKETGVKLAMIAGKGLPGDSFIRLLSQDELHAADLDELSDFCACQLSHSSALAESKAISELFLRGWTSLYPDGTPSAEEISAAETRSHSLAYLAILADAASGQETEFDTKVFRAESYTRTDPDGNGIEFPSALHIVCDGWSAYQRNELVSIALQGLFFAILRAAELGRSSFHTTAELSDWFWRESIGREVIQHLGAGSAGELLSASFRKLPDFRNWANDGHEVQCMDRLQLLTDRDGLSQSDVLTVVEDSLAIIAAIVMRPENAAGYGQYRFPEKYLIDYPVNLSSVQTEWKQSIWGMPVEAGLSLFTRLNCLDAHLRVAMRKLRQQGQNTFRFEPSESGLLVKAIPRAAHTTPRFRQALRILLDLGLLENDEGMVRTTARGKAFVAFAA